MDIGLKESNAFLHPNGEVTLQLEFEIRVGGGKYKWIIISNRTLTQTVRGGTISRV
jgi:hypothetical protein